MEDSKNTDIAWQIWNPVSIAKFVFFLLTAVIIIVLNSLVITAFVKFRRLRTPTNYFLVSLAIADVLFGLLTLPGNLLGEFEVFGDDEFACVIINSPTLILPSSALLNLIAAGIERYIALVHPFRHPVWVTGKRVVITILIIWLYSALLGFLPIVGVNNINEREEINMTLPFCNFIRVTPGKYVGFVTLSTHVPGIILLSIVNIKVFHLAYRQRRQVHAQQQHLPATKASENKRRVVVFVLVTLGNIFVVAHIPFFLTMAIDYQYYTINLVRDVRVPFEAYVLTSCLVSLCPVAYPLVMAFGNRDIRLSICGLCKGQSQITEISHIHSQNSATETSKQCDTLGAYS